jgi:hypothetical protein
VGGAEVIELKFFPFNRKKLYLLQLLIFRFRSCSLCFFQPGIVASLRLASGASLFFLKGVGALFKKKSKQKSQDAPNSLNARTVERRKMHLAKAIAS